MDYIAKLMNKADELAGAVYSTLFRNQYAFAGVPNNSLDRDKDKSDGLEYYSCFSSSKPHKKGRTNLHRPVHQITVFFKGKNRVIDIPKDEKCSLKNHLISCGLSPKRATEEIKKLH
jgi:hypothetical protein